MRLDASVESRSRHLLLTAFSLLLLAAGGFMAAPVQAQDSYAAPLKKMELQDGDSLVFLGDSITHQCLYTQYVEDYFYTRMPNLRLKIHNAGVGGARAWDALARFDEDVASYKPKYVTILLGMNDGSYQPYNEEVFQTYRQDMTELLERLKSINATAIVMTPTMFDSRAARMRANPRRPRSEEMLTLYNGVLAFYGSWLREQANSRGLGYVDMYSPLNNHTLQQRKSDPNFTLIRDAVHPDPPGQVLMATAIIQDTGLPRQVSNIRVTLNPNGKATSRVFGGKISGLQATDRGLKFTWQANSLPWVLPENAALGVQLTKLGHKLSREAMEVHGLPVGQYQLLIDGEIVGQYTNAQLERHIELQANAKTPQHQQAAKVAELNAQRNQGPVRALRGEWSQFQRFARAKRDAQAKPDDAQLKKQVETLTQRMEGMQQRVAKAKADAQEIEDQIFEVNQIPARSYELRRVVR